MADSFQCMTKPTAIKKKLKKRKKRKINENILIFSVRVVDPRMLVY